MSRVISTSSIRRERELLLRGVAQAARAFKPDNNGTAEGLDQAAFIVLGLEKIQAGVERTVTPWEKRGYWMKADKFRLEWEWTERKARELRSALDDSNWAAIDEGVGWVAKHLEGVRIPERGKPRAPWKGAWGVLRAQTR